MKHFWLICLLCILMTGCGRLDSETFWIRENVPEITQVPKDTIVTQATQIEETMGLCIDGSVTEEAELCFAADLQALCNDLSIRWARQITQEHWQMEKDTLAPYSRIQTRYLRLDVDPMLKNEPTLCVYLTEEGRICETTAILLTHDWTEAQEVSFLRLGKDLLQCVWPSCDDAALKDAVQKLRQDIGKNVYPDNSAIPQPMTVYVHGSAAAYGYTHAANISIHVIPVNDTRLQELETAGVQIIEIP